MLTISALHCNLVLVPLLNQKYVEVPKFVVLSRDQTPERN